MFEPSQTSPVSGCGFTGNDVHHGRFTGAIRTDNTAQVRPL